MRQKLPLLLTLDYEMFNGKKSGTTQNCMITPTKELLKILDKHNFKATFFVDMCYVLRLRKEALQNDELKKDYDNVLSQLKVLAVNGHDLQLHLHPNWYHANYSDGELHSVVDDYKLSDMSKDEVEEMFREGTSFLKSITGKPVIAFRAGAYCLPTLLNYIEVFRHYGIVGDSSVNRNRKEETEKWAQFDYTDIPKEYLYRFSSSITRKDNHGEFVEVSIPNYPTNWFSTQLSSILSKRHRHTAWGDGTGTIGGELLPMWQKILVKLSRHMKSSVRVASIDNVNAGLFSIFKKEIKRRGDYMLIMGHPKCFMPEALQEFDAFLSKAKGMYENVTVAELIMKFKKHEDSSYCNL